MRHFIVLLLALFFAGAAQAQTAVQWGLATGANPRTLCVYDTSPTRPCVPVGALDNVAHTFTSNVVLNIGTPRAGYSATLGLGSAANYSSSWQLEIADYCTTAQIATDISTCAQNAINAAQALATSSFGGAVVHFPAALSPYTLTSGSLAVTASFVTLRGDAQQGSYIKCANGSSDCIRIGQSTGAFIRDIRVLDLGVWGVSKTAGAGIHVMNAYIVLVQNVDLENMIRGVDNDATVGGGTNSVTLRDMVITPNQAASDYGVYWHAPGDGSKRSDQFNLENVAINAQWNAPSVEGIRWDGLTQTMAMSRVVVMQTKYGIRVMNSAGSSSYFPGFLNADNVQVEGVTLRAISIEAGADYKISNSDFNNSYGVTSQGNADDYAVAILPDTGASITRGVQITNSRIGLNGKAGVYVGGREVVLSNIQFVSVGQSANNTYPAIDMVATANDLQVSNIRGEEFGGASKASYVVQLESGAAGFNGVNIDGRYVVSGAVNDLGAAQSCYNNLIEPNGYTGVMQNTCTTGMSGILQDVLYNNMTGANVKVGSKIVTGTVNSFAQTYLNDNNGSPFLWTQIGSGVGIWYIDVAAHVWRSASATEWMRLDSTALKLQVPIQMNGVAAVSCAAGTVNTGTMVIANGIVTHC
jgi:hypothetical protein